MSGTERRGRSLALYVVVTYGVTWALLLPLVLSTDDATDPLLLGLYVLGAFVPSAVALGVAWWEGGGRAARSLLGRVTRWRVAPRWYVAALVVAPGIKGLAVVALVLAGYPAPALPAPAEWPLVVAVAVVGGLFPGAIGEELGWRGFALPRLQERYGALAASLALGVVWALWHLPTFFVEFTGQAAVPAEWLLVEITGASVLYAWVVNNARGSVLLAILFHASNNALTPVLYPAIADAGYLDVYAAATAVGVWVGAVAVVLAFGPADLSRSRTATTPDD